jgi:nucleotide-binding universal stress UspA family protein
MLTVRSILCPVDFSEQSRQALLWASAVAQYREAELTVLSAVEPLLAQAAGIRLGVDLRRLTRRLHYASLSTPHCLNARGRHHLSSMRSRRSRRPHALPLRVRHSEPLYPVNGP